MSDDDAKRKEAKRQYLIAYRQRPEVREAKRQYLIAYRHRPEVRETKRQYFIAYRQRPDTIARRQRPEVKEAKRQSLIAYRQRPEAKEAYRIRNKRPHVIEARRRTKATFLNNEKKPERRAASIRKKLARELNVSVTEVPSRLVEAKVVLLEIRGLLRQIKTEVKTREG